MLTLDALVHRFHQAAPVTYVSKTIKFILKTWHAR